MHIKTLSPLAAFAISLCSGCSPSSDPQALEPVALTVPAGPDSSGPRLSAGADGALVLSWMEPDAVDTSLRYSRLKDGNWSEARTVVSGVPMFVNWADLPSVVPMSEEHLVAHWLLQRPDNTYSYDVTVAQSVDGGATWLAAMTPHSDGTPTEHGFVSIFEHRDQAALIWLDGRKMVNEVTDDPTESGMTLRAAFVDTESTLDGEQVVDTLVCDCCQTDVAVAASGPVAVYRDRSVDEIRDIYVTRLVDGSWQPGQAIAADNWEIAGCPVNGPSIAAQDGSVAVAWFTGAGSIPKVQFATSINGGASFSDAVEVISENTLGRVGVTLLDDDNAAVSWLQNDADGNANVMVRKINSRGELGVAVVISKTAAQFAVPQMARVGDQLIFAWSESHDDADRVASAQIAIKALD